MAQSKSLLRFRARLRSRGYVNIRIKKAFNLVGERAFDERGNELWLVTCTEPLLGFEASFVCSEIEMDSWPGLYLDRNGFFSKQLDFFDEDNIPEQIYEGGDGIFV